MAELVDAHDSKSCSFGSESSILSSGTTIIKNKNTLNWVFLYIEDHPRYNYQILITITSVGRSCKTNDLPHLVSCWRKTR